VIPGQSLRKSRSSNLKLVTNSLTSDGIAEALDCGLAFVLTDKLRSREVPLLVLVVVVDACDVVRDIAASCALSLCARGVDIADARCFWAVYGDSRCCLCAKAEGSDKSAGSFALPFVIGLFVCPNICTQIVV
jgi:hypothetical protein